MFYHFPLYPLPGAFSTVYVVGSDVVWLGYKLREEGLVIIQQVLAPLVSDLFSNAVCCSAVTMAG